VFRPVKYLAAAPLAAALFLALLVPARAANKEPATEGGPARMRLMTQAQYANTMAYIFGPTLKLRTRFRRCPGRRVFWPSRRHGGVNAQRRGAVSSQRLCGGGASGSTRYTGNICSPAPSLDPGAGSRLRRDVPRAHGTAALPPAVDGRELKNAVTVAGQTAGELS